MSILKPFAITLKITMRESFFIPLIFHILLIIPISSNAQDYTVGVAVSDSAWPSATIYAECPDDFLTFKLDSLLIPYVAGLSFQVVITAADGAVLSDVGDTVKVGDIFSLPAATESGILKINFTQLGDSFSFFIKLVGTPEIAGESYFCSVLCSITTALCHNQIELYSFEEDSMCAVKSTPSSIDDPPQLPIEHILKQNYPNPFNPATDIEYQISERSHVTLRIHDLLGQTVRSLVDRQEQSGWYKVRWDGKSDAGFDVASGIYIYRLISGNQAESRKLLLIR